jgi:competence protein ComEA
LLAVAGGVGMSNKILGPTRTAFASSGAVIAVHVSGEVKKPGLVELRDGARVQDALDAAGGETRNADMERVNLAEKLDDGCKVRVPAVGDAEDRPVVTRAAGSAPTALKSSSRSSTGTSSRASGKKVLPAPGSIDLNKATAEDLQKLPGVGPSTAQKILAFRAQAGRFTSIEQMMDVKGIGPAKFAKMRPYLRI